ncbi:MAG: desaturase [Flammeovirgaceae bacterium]|nr:desaturase [Flammeovirgaceae bacterium]
MSDNLDKKKVNSAWNYHPGIPLQNNSLFRLPLYSSFLIAWINRNWFQLSEKVILVIISILIWYFVYPSLDQTKNFELTWIFQIWVINLVLMIMIAGGLHWYFCIIKGQEKRLKFDKREQGKGKLWDFSNQVHDNMFWSLTSGICQLTIFQSITMWLLANNYSPVNSFISNPFWFFGFFLFLPIWSAFHFYWIHRFLHIPFFYKRYHSLHHRNINVGPWSGFSMHPVEHFFYISSICIHWILASHPIHVIFHALYLGPGAAMTHTGYESLLIKDKKRLALGTFYHQLHHRYYECNYGNEEMPWDRWFGTFHDGSQLATEQTRARKKVMHK